MQLERGISHHHRPTQQVGEKINKLKWTFLEVYQTYEEWVQPNFQRKFHQQIGLLLISTMLDNAIIVKLSFI